jgi:signal transduction histidine kinase
MKTSIRKKLIIISFIILSGNGIIGYAFYKSNQKLHDSENWVQHTEQVIYQSGNILSLTKDIIIEVRGFVITNDSSFLDSYLQPNSILPFIESLRQLTQDNLPQQNRIDSLNFYIQKYLEYSVQTVQIRSQQGLKQAIAFISSKQGKRYNDRIRQIINNIQQEETELLIQRKQTNMDSMASFNRVAMIMFVIMTVFTILLLIVTGNNLFQNQEKEKRAAELIIANRELIFQNEEKEKRAAELVIADKELIFQNEEKVKQEAANKELEAFSYSVSHDLRAPLRHIGGFIDLMIKNNSSQLDATGLRYLNTISESSHEMGNLIDGLLTFSRYSRTELKRTRINSKNLVDHVLKTFSDEFAGRIIEINIKELSDVSVDENLIIQVWVNLISNALKYSRNKEKTVIEIGSKMEKETTVFYIKDNGTGFDMKYAGKLFGVFQRLHKARDFEGIGIGLANVNRIVTRHGGTCWAESEVDKGATFFFSIPNNNF